MKHISSPSAFALALASSLALAACARQPVPAPVRVAAAADLSGAFEELGRAFTRQTGTQLAFSFGSSGLLARQLAEGAPFDVFAAANLAFVDAAVQEGACDRATLSTYARGRLVLWVKKGAAFVPRTLAELAEPRVKRLSLANPEHAPYGKAAQQALTSAGVWEQVRLRAVLAENVRQALQLAQTGNVEAALVALSLVVEDHENPWTLVAESLHAPIEQALAACVRGKNRAGGEAFVKFVQAPAGRTVLSAHGFVVPGERVDAPK